MEEIKNKKELFKRLKGYYFYADIIRSSRFKFWLDKTDKYFDIIKKFDNGIGKRKISRELGVNRQTLKKWLRKESHPYLLRIANKLPSIKNNSYRWLPLKIYSQGIFKIENLIKVPNKISHFYEINKIASQVSNKLSKLNKKEFVNSFAYLTGILISDTGKRLETLSTKISLTLSKKYDWSTEFGNAFCYCLLNMGIKSKRVKGKKSAFVWAGENSPLITWMMRSVLGLKKGETTTKNSLDMNWLLKTPRNFRLLVLQGIADGDGCAELSGWRLSIASDINSNLFKKLLKTFKIHSNYGEKEITIVRKDAINKSVNLPLFKHARGRLIKAKKILEMLEHSNGRGYNNIENPAIIRKIFFLRSNKYSVGDISEKIFDEFKIGIRPSTIFSVIKRGRSSYNINRELVKTYFLVLKNQDNKESLRRLEIDDRSVYRWTKENKIPLDVKRFLQSGFKPDQKIIEEFPLIRKYMEDN